NAARHPARSLLTTGLLASAAFLIVAVEAFRREVGAQENAAAPANGGFTLLAESDLPIIRDLNRKEGRQEILDRLLPQFREELQGDNAAAQQRVEEARGLLEQVQIVAFRVHAGDDASCLNLYQPRRPRLLGVPRQLIDKDGFVFAAISGKEGSGDPWMLLLRE